MEPGVLGAVWVVLTLFAVATAVWMSLTGRIDGQCRFRLLVLILAVPVIGALAALVSMAATLYGARPKLPELAR